MQLSTHVTYLMCPDCKSKVEISDDFLLCMSCRRVFHQPNGVFDMLPMASPEDIKFYSDPDYIRGQSILPRFHELLYDKDSISGKIELYFKRNLMSIAEEIHEPILDIGCGAGNLFPFYGNEKKIIGVDISRPLLETCKSKYPDSLCIHCDMTSPPIKPNSIRTIFSSGALEHVFFLEKLISEVDNILATTGNFYILIPNEGGLAWKGLRLLAHFKFSRTLKINYKQFAEIEHCNKVVTVENVLYKFFKFKHIVRIPFRIGGTHINLVSLYHVTKR